MKDIKVEQIINDSLFGIIYDALSITCFGESANKENYIT